MNYRLLFSALFVALSFGCASENTETPATPSAGTGKIRGVVRLTGDLPAPATDPIDPEFQKVCGEKASLSRLALGNDKGVRNAFVFLEGVAPVQELQPRESVLIDQKDCQYAPHSVTVTTGTKLEFTNSDDLFHSAVGRQDGENGPETLFNIGQPVKGARNITGSPMTKPGIILLTCDAGHPWMFAYVLVADHPYVAVTRDNGEFVIENVPPGTYKIKMWHEGVTIKKIHKNLKLYEYEAPYEVVKEVKVEANGETVLDFDFGIRPAAEAD